MLSDEEDEVNEVIKVSNLVAKFESEIRKQTADERLIHTVRQVLRESRKVQKHPLQEHEGEERSEYIISTADIKPGPDQDLSACTDKPRVKTRVLQHNRFTQLREKCSEIITKSVRNKSKPPPALYPRPNSFIQNTNKANKNDRKDSVPDRRATFHSNRSPKTYELKDVNDIGEGFEIINIDDCVSEDEDRNRRSPQVVPLDLYERNTRNRSVESLDSGCDIETPRPTQIDKQVRMFQKLSLDEGDTTKLKGERIKGSAVVDTKVISNENLVVETKTTSNENTVLETKVTSKDVTTPESDSSSNAISIVCNIQLVSNSAQVSPEPELSQKSFDLELKNSGSFELPGDSHSKIQASELPSDSHGKIQASELPGDSHGEIQASELPSDSHGKIQASELSSDSHGEIQAFEQDSLTSSQEDEDISQLQFSEIFKLFEPNKNIDEDVSQYAKDLRAKLAWKLATEKVLKSSESVPQEEWKDDSPGKCLESSKPKKVRSECPVYEDPELEAFLSRCFGIACSVHENISVPQESEESLLNFFIPKELIIPEVSELDLNSEDSDSVDSSSWSDGEYLDIND